MYPGFENQCLGNGLKKVKSTLEDFLNLQYRLTATHIPAYELMCSAVSNSLRRYGL